MDRAAVRDRLSGLGLKEIGFIEWEQIPFAQDVRRMCEMNACGNYGTNWMCPPALGEMDELYERCRGYAHIMLVSYVKELTDSYDLEGRAQGKRELQEILWQIRNILREQFSANRMLVLGAGGCMLCGECTFRSRQPCRYPDKALPPVEGMGIHVSQLCANAGFQYNNGKDTVTHFGLVFFDRH